MRPLHWPTLKQELLTLPLHERRQLVLEALNKTILKGKGETDECPNHR